MRPNRKNRGFDQNNPIEVFIEKMESKISRTKIKNLSETTIKEKKKNAKEAIDELLKVDPDALKNIKINYVIFDKRLLPVEKLGIEKPNEITTGLLHITCYLRIPIFIEALLEAGADVNLQDAQGMTPLHYLALAGSNNQKECLEILKKNNKLRTDVLNNCGYSPFSLLGESRIIQEVAISLLGGLKLGDYEMEVIPELNIGQFTALSKKYPKLGLNEFSLQEKLINLLSKKKFAHLADINANCPLLVHLLSECSTHSSQSNAYVINMFLSEQRNFFNFFVEKNSNVLKQKKSQSLFTQICNILNNVKNYPELYKDLRDEMNNNICHFLLNAANYYLTFYSDSGTNMEEKIQAYIIPILVVYKDLLYERNSLGFCPLFNTLSRFNNNKLETVQNKLYNYKINSPFLKSLLNSIFSNEQYFISLLMGSDIRYDLVKIIYRSKQQSLAELMFPLATSSIYIYPEIIKAIDEIKDVKPTPLLLSALRLQLAIACNDMQPLYEMILGVLGQNIGLKEGNIISPNPIANLIPELPVELRKSFLSEIKVLNPNVLLGLRTKIPEYIKELATQLLNLTKRITEIELSPQQTPNNLTKKCDLNVWLGHLKSLMENLLLIAGIDHKKVLTTMVSLLNNEQITIEQSFTQAPDDKNLQQRLIAAKMQHDSFKQMTVNIIHNVRHTKGDNLECNAWSKWRKKKFDFIKALHNMKELLQFAFDSNQEAVNKFAQEIKSYEKNYLEFVDFYLKLYDLEKLNESPMLFSFKQLFNYKDHLEDLNLQTSMKNALNAHSEQRVESVYVKEKLAATSDLSQSYYYSSFWDTPSLPTFFNYQAPQEEEDDNILEAVEINSMEIDSGDQKNGSFDLDESMDQFISLFEKDEDEDLDKPGQKRQKFS